MGRLSPGRVSREQWCDLLKWLRTLEHARASPNSPAVPSMWSERPTDGEGSSDASPSPPRPSPRRRTCWVPPEGLSIIWYRDTVKVSNVNKRELLANTFLREFTPIEGMAALFRRWGRAHGAVFHYVSASPWQLWAAGLSPKVSHAAGSFSSHRSIE